MSNNKQEIELTDITAPVQPATQGLTMKDRDASTSAERGENRRKDKQPVEQTEITVYSPEANQGFSMEDRDASTSTLNDENIGFLLDCAKRGENRGNQHPPSICKVSRILRDDNESLFIPQLVSIGPIHREDPKLQEFEGLKECYLNDLLNRCNSMPKETLLLEACLPKVNDLIPKIRESYDGVIKKYSDVDLARMMVMDGCFILEFCFKLKDDKLLNKMQNLRIAKDLMLLENQVPFVVLQALFDCLAPYIVKRKGSVTLSQILDTGLARYIKLFRVLTEKKSILSKVRKLLCSLLPEKISDLPKKNSTTNVDSDSTHAHVLGYLHKRYQLVAAKSSKAKHAEASKPVDEEQAAKSSKAKYAEASKLVDEEGIEDTAFHSIVELDLSGVNFKPHQKNIWPMTIKFQVSFFPWYITWLWVCSGCCCCHCCCLFPCLPWFWIKPILLMPTLVIDHFTELILRNFIAYEQSFPQDHHCFTSYAVAMDRLIDTQEDIAKLVESKVLVNMLGTNQEAADMINKVCKNISITDFCYTEEFKQMDKFYNRCLPKHTARLRRVYFSNPWSIIALVAAIILFVLTVLQTIYTIKEADGSNQ